ncbi:general stress protein 13 [Spiroplasma sp. TIUS-1]|uniref:S1 RNA-binding domain-containing protein n=1 Tax=Spiroplasma sp. TIUS-1 TaxID=216963 RepID=UPI001398191C|nr:S1 RNA-binding domain-containing protein [Spiroplasma sp. TIUS-1]QHX35800.1 general stress protein 13 [Spiroplasma sp. TIUS-1]
MKKADNIKVKITAIENFGAFIEHHDENQIWKGLIHISEFSDFFVTSITDFVNVGDEVEVEILEINNDKKQLKLSYKSIRPELKKSSEIRETGNGFNKLKSNTDNKVKG